jgi:hypothetical protein
VLPNAGKPGPTVMLASQRNARMAN